MVLLHPCRDLLDEDLVKYLGNVGDVKIATLSECYNSVVFSEDASLASQASLVDTNAAASLAKYIRQNMALIMAANNMSMPNADVNVWVWASNLNVMIKELGEQHMRFSANLCALLKSGPPAAVAAEGHEAQELKRSQHVAKIASLEGLLARIKGCTLVINDLAAWAEFFKSGDAQEQHDAQALPAIGDGSWPSYLAAGVSANDAAVILCAQKETHELATARGFD